MITTDKIEKLRQFFKISVAMFEARQKIVEAFGAKVKDDTMYKLHQEALKEVERESPDLGKVIQLLVKMELLTEDAKGYPAPEFPKGGA